MLQHREQEKKPIVCEPSHPTQLLRVTDMENPRPERDARNPYNRAAGGTDEAAPWRIVER